VWGAGDPLTRRLLRCGSNWIYCDSHARWAKLANSLGPWDAWNDKEGLNPALKDLPKHNKVTGCQ
jgi:hypothetical protein